MQVRIAMLADSAQAARDGAPQGPCHFGIASNSESFPMPARARFAGDKAAPRTRSRQACTTNSPAKELRPLRSDTLAELLCCEPHFGFRA